MSYDPTKPYKSEILKLIEATWDSPYLKVRPGLYPIFEKTFSGPEIDHTDGIGTKGEIHWRHRTWRAAILDALAMNLNDLAMARAQAYKLQNHLVLPADDHQAILEIISILSNECRQRQIVMTGGETSIHAQALGLDISLTVSGLLIKDLPNNVKVGDVVLGLPSSGIHANGISRFREVLSDEVPELLVPTVIYADRLRSVIDHQAIHGMMHITGGAMTKIKDILEGVDVVIERGHTLRPQPIFRRLFQTGISDEEMYRTWNCGIGFVLTVDANFAEQVVKQVGAVRIGRAILGSGKVVVESGFSSSVVEY